MFPGTTLTVAFGINNVGEMIVGEYGCGTLPLANNAFLLTEGSLTTLPNVPGANATNANAINDAGDIVGTYLAGGARHGFLLSGGVFTTIDFPGATLNQVFGINNGGQIIGETSDSSFLFSGGTFTAINVPGGLGTAARSINNLGDIVGSYGSDGRAHGFLLSDGVFATIDSPGAANTYVFGINNLGDVVGRYQPAAGGDSHGFLLSDGTFTTIDVPGFTNTILYGINDAGDMVGNAYNSSQFETQGILVSTNHGTLSVVVTGSGGGSVTGAPGIIQCPPVCAETYRTGTTVTLTATPASGSVFAGWSGDAPCATGVITLNADTSCTATFTADAAAPGTTITGGPSGAITVNAPTFTWSGSDNLTPVGNLVYAFRLVPLEASFSAFGSTTSTTYTGLASGSYTFYVKAKDEAGNETSPPASRSFTVDTLPPDTSITAGPSGTIAVNTAAFTWTGVDNRTPTASLTYAYRLDPVEGSFSAFGSATSKSYAGLANGSYTFYVKARDQAGNEDPTPAGQTFTVLLGRDLVEVSLTNPPATAKRGRKFQITDTVKNQGGVATKTSTTRYYLSADWTADRRLTGSHSVPALAPGAIYPKTVTVTIPSNMFPGTYHLLACVDDTGRVAESVETNNCLSSAATIQVTP